ncbi:MAG: adenosine kinase [Bacteroidales bacterium]|nr:adenosine kinase [Bacteroidales bacterium]MDD4235922.1 adenosine kinase [Bacteroidales bacterium]MDY0161039.1 adenosine kinase [Bacteroidales bacterium]
MNRILAMGNALVDIMTQLTDDSTLDNLQLPKGSMQLVDIKTSDDVREKTSHLHTHKASGGSAANTIRSLAMLGLKTGFIGKIGADKTGMFFKDDMIRTGVNPHLIESDIPSGCAVALVSPDSERTFATFLGAAAAMNPLEISEFIFDDYKFLHIEGYLVFNHELIEHALKIAKSKGLIVSMDMASFNVVEANLEFLVDMIIKYVDIVFANEEEAKALTGKSPEEALDNIAEWCDYAIVKVGENGSYIKHKNKVYKIDAIQSKPIDTTGAGDNYAAGFLFGLSQNWNLYKCGKTGSLLAGKVIEVLGTTMSDSVWNEIKTRVSNISLE